MAGAGGAVRTTTCLASATGAAPNTTRSSPLHSIINVAEQYWTPLSRYPSLQLQPGRWITWRDCGYWWPGDALWSVGWITAAWSDAGTALLGQV